MIRRIVNRLFNFQLRVDDPRLHDEIERWRSVSDRWDEPNLLSGLKRTVAGNRDVGNSA